MQFALRRRSTRRASGSPRPSTRAESTRPAITRRGLELAQPLLREIDALRERSQLPTLIAKLARQGIDAPLRVFVTPDAKDRRRYLLTIDQGGLGLPDRDDYVRDDARARALRAGYEAYAVRLASLGGLEGRRRDAAADYALQKDFAAASQSRVERRDPNAVYQLNTLATLEQRAPGMDWKKFFAALGVDDPREFNVASPGFVAAVARAAADAPLATWRAYLTIARARRTGAGASLQNGSRRASSIAARSSRGSNRTCRGPSR